MLHGYSHTSKARRAEARSGEEQAMVAMLLEDANEKVQLDVGGELITTSKVRPTM